MWAYLNGIQLVSADNCKVILLFCRTGPMKVGYVFFTKCSRLYEQIKWKPRTVAIYSGDDFTICSILWSVLELGRHSRVRSTGTSDFYPSGTVTSYWVPARCRYGSTQYSVDASWGAAAALPASPPEQQSSSPQTPPPLGGPQVPEDRACPGIFKQVPNSLYSGVRRSFCSSWFKNRDWLEFPVKKMPSSAMPVDISVQIHLTQMPSPQLYQSTKRCLLVLIWVTH